MKEEQVVQCPICRSLARDSDYEKRRITCLACGFVYENPIKDDASALPQDPTKLQGLNDKAKKDELREAAKRIKSKSGMFEVQTAKK